MRSIPTMNWSTAVSSRYSRMKFFASTLLPIVAMLMAPPALSQIVGTARVTDGDTIIIQSHRIRLHGIDAPESQQTCRSGTTIWHCGRSSTNALNERLSGYPVSCHARAQDRYGRTIAVCTVSGEDINAWLVSQGWALAYRKYSLDYTAHVLLPGLMPCACPGPLRSHHCRLHGFWRGYQRLACLPGLGACIPQVFPRLHRP